MTKVTLSTLTLAIFMILAPQAVSAVVVGETHPDAVSFEQNGHCTVADLESAKLQGSIIYGPRHFCDIPRATMDYWVRVLDQNKQKTIPITKYEFFKTPKEFYDDVVRYRRASYQALLGMDPNSEEGKKYQADIALYKSLTEDLAGVYRIYITPNPRDNALITSTLFTALRDHYANAQKPFYSDINIFDSYVQQGAPQRTITITTTSKEDAQQTLNLVYNALKNYTGRNLSGVPFRISATSLISWGQGSEDFKGDDLRALYDRERVYYRPGAVGLPDADYHLSNPAAAQK
ncbi:hypothetical protein KJZ61_04270 [Candidatus Dependentiae bacterium]|nr:hypothetical protein [Candidatus Dependentiae bacterium]